MVFDNVKLPVRLKTSAALFARLPPPRLPFAPPLPTCNVPPPMLIAPVKSLPPVFAIVSVPPPCFARPLLPLIFPLPLNV